MPRLVLVRYQAEKKLLKLLSHSRIIDVLSNLLTFSDFLRLICVCKCTSTLANDEKLWSQLYKSWLGSSSGPDTIYMVGKYAKIPVDSWKLLTRLGLGELPERKVLGRFFYDRKEGHARGMVLPSKVELSNVWQLKIQVTNTRKKINLVRLGSLKRNGEALLVFKVIPELIYSCHYPKDAIDAFNQEQVWKFLT